MNQYSAVSNRPAVRKSALAMVVVTAVPRGLKYLPSSAAEFGAKAYWPLS